MAVEYDRNMLLQWGNERANSCSTGKSSASRPYLYGASNGTDVMVPSINVWIPGEHRFRH